MRSLAALCLALGCLQAPGARDDAGFALADAPPAACGHRGAPCCEGGPACRAGAACRGGLCVADHPRCVATGIADEEITAGVFWEEFAVPGCAAVPRELLDEGTPGFYDPGDRAVGLLECEGLAPGRHVLSVHLRVRMLAPSHSASKCLCGTAVEADLQLVLNGREIAPLRRLHFDREDGSCRRGPDEDFNFLVTVPPDGNFSARLDLLRCMRGVPTRCLFVRGTSLSLDRAP